jgi:hypothetical protein
VCISKWLSAILIAIVVGQSSIAKADPRPRHTQVTLTHQQFERIVEASVVYFVERNKRQVANKNRAMAQFLRTYDRANRTDFIHKYAFYRPTYGYAVGLNGSAEIRDPALDKYMQTRGVHSGDLDKWKPPVSPATAGLPSGWADERPYLDVCVFGVSRLRTQRAEVDVDLIANGASPDVSSETYCTVYVNLSHGRWMVDRRHVSIRPADD